uniref:Uncharacterized protein n=1 Tax=Arundo donax TaxID=35708 RepID=A0A0A9D7Q4_ARUDO
MSSNTLLVPQIELDMSLNFALHCQKMSSNTLLVPQIELGMCLNFALHYCILVLSIMRTCIICQQFADFTRVINEAKY